MSRNTEHWLDRYASGYHVWHHGTEPEHYVYDRPLGLVETGFHIDGCHYGGRADFHAALRLKLTYTGDPRDLERHVTLAWTALRLQHVLMLATVGETHRSGSADLSFNISVPRTADGAVERCRADLIFVDSAKSLTDAHDFRRYSLSCPRLLDHEKCLSRLFVLGMGGAEGGSVALDFLLYAAHMLADGLTMYRWLSQFQKLVDKSERDLLALIDAAVSSTEPTRSILPPPQEDVYLQVPGNMARQRWFWLVMRLFRHLRTPKAAGFVNPLRRDTRPEPALPQTSRFDQYLDHSGNNRPSLESGIAVVRLSKLATARLFSLCRRAGASIGAGGFVLLGMVMMQMYEDKSPDLALEDRQPFVGSFPLNPRPFLNYAGPHDSCMLAFSEGIVVPYLPSHLDVERRFGVLVKVANRELRSYQKKARDAVNAIDPHSPLRLQASTYLMLYEGVDKRLPAGLQKGVSVQGQYPVQPLWGRATCGVSSLGRIGHLFAPNTGPARLRDDKRVAADFESLSVGVRARENEFLVGMRTSFDERLEISVSYDATAMDSGQVEKWCMLMENIMEPKPS